MARYISNKKVNSNKANDLPDFDSIGDSIWNFISAIYQANWDFFLTDNKTKSLREKIASKFSPRIVLTTTKSNKEQAKSISITINKVPPPPPLPVKSKKEVNVISKYFQSKKPLAKNKNQVGNINLARSYTQATKMSANMSEVLKIKEAFPALNAKKIDQINSIVKGDLKPKPRVIKVSPKSDMSIVWIDIWNVQSGSNAKMLINRCFNVGRYIVTIQEANMNPGVLQCKNCWKWGHTTFLCRIQGLKCVKCNGPHKSENHHEFRWYCKANDKINPPRLETKKEELCPHSFKCSNC